MSRRAGRMIVLALAFQLSASWTIAQDRPDSIAEGRRLFTEQGCNGCHTVGKIGTPIAPDLSRVGAKYTLTYLANWLRDPAAQRPTAHMPRITLTEAEVHALSAYLASLR